MTLPRVACLLALAALSPAAAAQLFLVDDTHKPHVKVSWPTRDGPEVSLEQDREYRAVNDRTSLGKNLECFVAVGGIRLARGVAHPRGFIIRVGFVKTDIEKPLFDGLADDAVIAFELSNIAFTAPAVPEPQTVIQESGYGLDPNLCGVPGQPDAQYNTASPTDDLRGKITIDNGRLGGLDGSESGDGKIEFTTAADGTIGMTARIPYALFRHIKDPWQSTKPGTFNEPNHFHIEFEAIPETLEAKPTTTGQ